MNTRWKDLGLALELSEGKLEEIECDKSKMRERMWEMISVWLSGNGIKATWRNLLDALSTQQVNKEKFAEGLKKKLTGEEMPDTK